MKRLILLLTIITSATTIFASTLVEKATIIDHILNKTTTQELLAAFEKSSSMGKSLMSIKNYPSNRDGDELFFVKVEELLRDGLGETIMKTYSVEELEVIQELFDSGDVKRLLALRLLCAPIALDPMLNSSFGKLLTERSQNYMKHKNNKKKNSNQKLEPSVKTSVE